MSLAEYIEPVGGNGKDAPHALRQPQAVAARLWRWLEGARAKDKTLKRIFVTQKSS
ncbi:MAG: hypothetical protein WC708_08610 [Lentisphaeria bacterium]